MADGNNSFLEVAREITSRPAPIPNAPTLYADTGANGSTKLYSDPARTRWVMVVYRQLSEGEVVENNGLKFHPITWGNEAKPQAQAA